MGSGSSPCTWQGVDPGENVEGYGCPLQLAAHWRHLGVVRLLLDHSMTLNIFSAALLGDADAVRRLLDGDPSLATMPAPNGAPPLHFTTTPRVAELLLDHVCGHTQPDCCRRRAPEK